MVAVAIRLVWEEVQRRGRIELGPKGNKHVWLALIQQSTRTSDPPIPKNGGVFAIRNRRKYAAASLCV